MDNVITLGADFACSQTVVSSSSWVIGALGRPCPCHCLGHTRGVSFRTKVHDCRVTSVLHFLSCHGCLPFSVGTANVCGVVSPSLDFLTCKAVKALTLMDVCVVTVSLFRILYCKCQRLVSH